MGNLEVERKIEMRQLRNWISEIQKSIYTQRQPVGKIQACVTGPDRGPERAPKSGWKPFKVHERWGGFDQTTWFRMTAVIPPSMKGRRVVALIRPGRGPSRPDIDTLSAPGESLAYVNGKPFQGLDMYRDELYLTEKARAGQKFEIVLEAVPSVRFDTHHMFQYADIAAMNPLVWDFYWDALVVLEVCETIEEDYAPRRQLLELLNTAVRSVDLQHAGESAYYDSIAKAQRTLRRGLREFKTSYGMGKLTLAGHSHLDTAWLWPLRETRRKVGRTFSNMLNLMDRYPGFHFSASQPVQYEYAKQHYPELYGRIKQRVKEGRWEPCGAMWVEADCNVTSGEALVRQLLYGNRFFWQEFGVHSRTAWLPDVFGYCWSLPQILKKAQVDTFVTTKMSWSQFTEFPYNMFQWEGADGSRVVGLLPPLNYNGNPTPATCIKQWNLFKQKEKVEELPFPFGWGDGGGGSTMAMIERGKRMANIVGVPQCEFGRIQDCLDRMQEQCDVGQLPVWNGELYLEVHRGCQTTQARTKRNNRKTEIALHNAEFVSSLASLNGAKYDKKTLYEAWKIVLTNQFHDILPGSSVNEVYTQADRDYAEAQDAVAHVHDAAANHLLTKIDTSGEGMPIVIFNTLSWVRSDVVTVRTELPKGRFSVLDPKGSPVLHQRTGRREVIFQATGVPPLGYATYRIVPGAKRLKPNGLLKASTSGIENQYLRIRFDKKGLLSSVYDKIERREVLVKGSKGNVLQLFDDRPQDWDAWDVDFNVDETYWEPGPAESIKVVEAGPVRAVVRIVRKTEKSTITQDITLHADSPRLDFVTDVDWHEKNTLLKAAFPVDVRSSNATYEIQFATIERPTHRNTAFDRARFEVAGQKWADLSEGDYGVSLLNNCKYGHDTRDKVLRLSLLRSPVDPDPEADQGGHHFTYALMPHAGDWRNGTVQQGFELNCPLIAAGAPNTKGPLPAAAALASVDAENVIIDTVKRHEDSNALVFRLYEAYGQRGDVKLTFGRTPKKVTECDLMEENDVPVSLNGSTIKLTITPYQIRTFKVTF